MPRNASSSIDRRITEIISRASRDVTQAVKQSIAEEVRRIVSGGGVRLDKAKGQRTRKTIFCPVPGCEKPGGGPKWGWFCADHKSLPDAEKDKARAATRGNGARAQAPAAPEPKRGRKKK